MSKNRYYSRHFKNNFQELTEVSICILFSYLQPRVFGLVLVSESAFHASWTPFHQKVGQAPQPPDPEQHELFIFVKDSVNLFVYLKKIIFYVFNCFNKLVSKINFKNYFNIFLNKKYFKKQSLIQYQTTSKKIFFFTKGRSILCCAPIIYVNVIFFLLIILVYILM